MAPQTSIPPAANVLGTIGTVFWCIQLLPQIYRSYRTKSTEGVPPAMMFLWSASGVPFGAYAIVQNFNIPIQIQPQCFCLFCLVNWGQCMYYSSKWKARNVFMICTAILVLDGGLQGLLVWLLRMAYYEKNLEWPLTFIGAVAFVLLISGYIPIPSELIKRRGRVVGIDFLFLLIDWFGAFFSLMSLVAQNTFDPLFGTLYALCAFMEMSMFLSHGIWLLRTRRLRKKCKDAGLGFDSHPEALEWQNNGFKFPWKRTASAPRDPQSESADVVVSEPSEKIAPIATEDCV
ncbi:hypothetical protein LTR99_007754 [Exophiala xenobiotica]|uniref:PQ loop repeat protein n=1 Tax=Vermiconidia calcicola TaxID=1690605 RepID=A0AAV9Q8S0_9PEZI|nr:hypothetical protein LTR41_005020 [Exophiala xenobiotica]KAK5535275.1 hypothetical protein LTR25_006283 [Vermiconidia calcicola]KAK5546776.1 hypothetical protein LTR23_003147 [Chaetothyriales sp. CCFEE 6169]KAK5273675.1 hypothetical protein LTR96_000275 [Exophiala xenobiotica]KAK5281960.1 hypothetical protein LTR40_004017 [Exophiala xenobiotica]